MQLINCGVTEIYVLTGYLGHQIQEYINTINLNAKIICINTDPNLKPGERLVKSFNLIKGDFILLYCDNFIPDDGVIEKQLNSTTGVTLLLQKREKGNISIKNLLYAIYWGKERKPENPYVELGYIAVQSASFVSYLTKTMDINLALEKYSKSNEVYFHELFGTYNSLSDFKRYIDQSLHGKILILDRDGIINVKMEPRKYLTSMDRFIYIEKNIDIISCLGQNNYNFIIATNQPGVATGVVSESFLSELHQKITSDLRRRKINILTFYVCKHHWDDLCECRKPKPGMLNQAIKDFKLNKKDLYFIGDEDKDMIAAAAAEVTGIKFLPNDHKLNLSLANKLID
jgi:D-glycero-D-manno-heptose 1,7-bisphosphate phosphatase